MSEACLVAIGERILVLSEQVQDDFSTCHLNERQGIADDGVVNDLVVVKGTVGHWS